MKKQILMGLAGLVLFAVSFVGLLAVQGRLNHEGTKGVPILHSFFPAPATTGEEGGGHAADSTSHGQEDGERKVDLTDFQDPEPLKREPGPSVDPSQVPAVPEDRSAHGVPVGAESDGHAPEADDNLAGGDGTVGGDGLDGGHGESVTYHDPPPGPGGVSTYRPGSLFDFPRLESGMGTDELNGYVKTIEAERKALAIQRASLAQREADIEARDSDIRARERNVRDLMQRITQERAKMEAEFREQEKRATIIRRAEAGKYAEYADRLASMEATRASAILLQMWNAKDPVEQKSAVKILFEMRQSNEEAVDSILATIDERQAKVILDSLTSAVREGGR